MLIPLLLCCYIIPVRSFWRLPCAAPLVTERADPIMNPGTLANHLHTIMGGNAFDFSMSYNDTQTATCSSCAVTKDFSNYWAPTLYYRAENGSFINVEQNGGALIYYLQRSDPLDPEYENGLLAFPAGFRMTAGDRLLRDYTDTLEQQAISFACLGTQTAETHGLPDINCPDGLRAQVFFPSCWDGVNLDSHDHKSHMAYPSVYNAGHCPISHPKRFISIFYEITWNVDAFSDMWYKATSHPFVLSTGDPTGYSYHGDFINGWDVPTLQAAVNNCTAADGVIEECPVFSFFPDNVTSGCKLPPSVDEPTIGILSALPGCNPIREGPEPAPANETCTNVTNKIGSPQYTYADLTLSHGFAYLGCGSDSAGQSRTLSGPQLVAANLTNAYCAEWCGVQNYSIAGTEYATQCFCGDEVAADRMPTPGLMGNCDMPCVGASVPADEGASEMCGGNAMISLYRRCVDVEACHNAGYGGGAAGAGSSGLDRNATVATRRRISSRLLG